MSRDRVSHETAALVLRRDSATMRRAGIMGNLADKPRAGYAPICLAPVVDRAELANCWGRTTLDHIKPEPRMGVRAKSIPEQLASVCQGHSEDGMKAGHQWNTAHRPELREILAKTTFRCARCDAVVVGPDCTFCGLPRHGTPAPQAVLPGGGR